MQRVTAASAALDAVTLACLALLLLGWFVMNTLVTRLGPLSQSVPFYQLLAVMHQPGLLFIGVGSGHALETCAFVALCLLALLAVVAPRFTDRPGAWLGGCAPLALMLISFALLYRGGPSWQPDDSSALNAFNGSVVRLANRAMVNLSGHAASHVGVDWGTFVALAASVTLAIRGTRRFLAQRAVPATQLVRPDRIGD